METMDLKDKKLCLLYRKPGRFFSIERIFRQLEPLFSTYLGVETWEAPFGKFRPKELAANIREARKCKADIYHVTGDIHYIVAGLPRRRTILTIHDCVFLYHTKGLKRSILKWFLLDMPVRRSSLITTISEATKRDIVRYSGCSPDKIRVIPDPVDASLQYVPARFREQEPVILFIGSTPNKNLARVAEALENIPCRLDIVGKISDDMTRVLSNHHLRYTRQSGLTDREMADKYIGADLVLFPSVFEGFGLPIIEGQKSGRPVVTSDCSPMKEVAGGGACLVNPYDSRSIREGVLRVIGDASYREQLVRDGFANVEHYAPEKIAQQYMACYRKILNL